MSKAKVVEKVLRGQASWRVRSDTVRAWVTRQGGHLGPVTFDRKGLKIKPYSIAPWAREKLPRDTPHVIRALRGDFFCMPFGGNDEPYRGEEHPVHGEPANEQWSLEGLDTDEQGQTLRLSMETTIREGRVDKAITLRHGHNAIYSRHTISGMSGSMPVGHHAMLEFPEEEGSGIISTSRFIYGQVFPDLVEDPAAGGYQSLEPGARFRSLSKVPTIFGDVADVSRYPVRRGFEDIVLMASDPEDDFAWTAVSFPEQGYVWLGLKNPRVLRSTLLWISNGGRHYAPWNGRHVNVMGMEEVTANFHLGVKASLGRSELRDNGIPTALRLSRRKPTEVSYIMMVVPVDADFGGVKSVKADKDWQSVTLRSETGQRVSAPVDLGFIL